MLGSGSLAVHVLRGALGASAVALSWWLGSDRPWWAALALGTALVLWRGCPTCWVVGLLETWLSRSTSARLGCKQGQCSAQPRAS